MKLSKEQTHLKLISKHMRELTATLTISEHKKDGQVG